MMKLRARKIMVCEEPRLRARQPRRPYPTLQPATPALTTWMRQARLSVGPEYLCRR
jgi:hypothetical protein